MGSHKSQMIEDVEASCSGCGELWEDLDKNHNEGDCCTREAFFAALDKDG